jgi:hypothetical protein
MAGDMAVGTAGGKAGGKADVPSRAWGSVSGDGAGLESMTTA